MKQLLRRLPPQTRLAAARATASLMMPYLTSGVMFMVPRAVVGLGTLGVTDRGVLLYDVEALADWDAREAGGVVLHEYLHIYREHAKRFWALRQAGKLQDTDDDHYLWNICADMEINDDLVAAQVPLPGEPWLPSTMEFPAGKLAEEYLAMFQSQGKRPNKPRPADGTGGPGQCGSGAGGKRLSCEPALDDAEGRSKAEMAAQHQVDKNHVTAASRSASMRGRVPLGIRLEAEAEDTPPVIPWQRKLAKLARRAVTFRAGIGDYTWTHRARFQEGMTRHYGDRTPILPGMHIPVVQMELCIDTSGSMSLDMIQKILVEVVGLLKAVPGARVKFRACDSAVHTTKHVNKVSQVIAGLKGGGGTDFRPVFEAIERTQPRPDVLVYFTDGDGYYPASAPHGMHVIWAMVGQSKYAQEHCEVPFGEVVSIDQTED